MWLTFFIAFSTLLGNYCVNKTLQYEKAGRATSYYSMELFYTFAFDTFVMNAKFTYIELGGLFLLVFANLYMYFAN
jgi:drug/metabolite transporter (DMT)-like permease